MKRIIYHFCFPYFIFHRHSNVIQSDRPYKEKWGRDRSWRLNPPQGVTERQGGISVLQDMKLCSRYVMCAAFDIRGLKGMAWNKLRSSKFTDMNQVNRMTHPHPHACKRTHSHTDTQAHSCFRLIWTGSTSCVGDTICQQQTWRGSKLI